MEEIKCQAVRQALEQAGGDHVKAAGLLGCAPITIQRTLALEEKLKLEKRAEKEGEET
jgi:hypothetical protein